MQVFMQYFFSGGRSSVHKHTLTRGGGSGGMLPQENFEFTTYETAASEVTYVYTNNNIVFGIFRGGGGSHGSPPLK